MATYTTIPDTDIDANSPITENLMRALRDNITATLEGDVSAPKLQTAAIADLAITAAKIADGGITNVKMSADSIKSANIDKTVASSVYNGEYSQYYTFPAGIYMVSDTPALQLFVEGTWRQVATSSVAPVIISNGSNVRTYYNGFYFMTYQKFA